MEMAAGAETERKREGKEIKERIERRQERKRRH
jgi:hypothetical protein